MPDTIQGHLAGIYNKKIFIVNGWYNIEYSYTTSIYLNESWESTSSIMMPFDSYSIIHYGQCFIQINDIIYGIPQYKTPTRDEYGTDLFAFNLVNNEYYNPSSYTSYIPTYTRWSCLANIDSILYVIGGYDIRFLLDNLQIYNISSGSWTYGTRMKIASYYNGCSGVKSNNAIYSFGGRNSTVGPMNNIMNQIQKYDITNNIWTTLSEILYTARFATCCIFSDFTSFIYCIGGTGSAGYLTRVEVFDTTNDQIRTENVLIETNENTNYPRLAIYGDYLYILGSTEYRLQFERYDLRSPLTDYPTTSNPTNNPTETTNHPTTTTPTNDPTNDPTNEPTSDPTVNPTINPTITPTVDPTVDPTMNPTVNPTVDPSFDPTIDPTFNPTVHPTMNPTIHPTIVPTHVPTQYPSVSSSSLTTELLVSNTSETTVDVADHTGMIKPFCLIISVLYIVYQ